MILPVDVGLALAALGVILTVYSIRLAQKSERRKRLVWDMSRAFPLARVLPQKPGPKLTIVYEPEDGPSMNVRGCYLSSVMIANLGREPIYEHELAPGDAVRLEVSNARVIDIAEAGVTRKVINFKVGERQQADGVVTAALTFDFLDFRDGALIRLLTESRRPQVRVVGTVIGMPEGIQRLGAIKYSTLRNRSGQAVIALLFALSFAAGLWVFYNAVGSWGLWWLLLLVPAMLIVPGILSVIAAFVVWPGGPGWPAGLQHPSWPPGARAEHRFVELDFVDDENVPDGESAVEAVSEDA